MDPPGDGAAGGGSRHRHVSDGATVAVAADRCQFVPVEERSDDDEDDDGDEEDDDDELVPLFAGPDPSVWRCFDDVSLLDELESDVDDVESCDPDESLSLSVEDVDRDDPARLSVL